MPRTRHRRLTTHRHGTNCGRSSTRKGLPRRSRSGRSLSSSLSSAARDARRGRQRGALTDYDAERKRAHFRESRQLTWDIAAGWGDEDCTLSKLASRNNTSTFKHVNKRATNKLFVRSIIYEPEPCRIERAERMRSVPRPLTSTEACCLALPKAHTARHSASERPPSATS